MNAWYLVFGVGVAIVAILVGYFYLKSRDPFKAAVSGFLSTLTILFGGLGLPDFKLNAKAGEIEFLGMQIEVDKIEFVIGTPMWLWIVACLSLTLLLCVYGNYILKDRIDKRKIEST